MAPEAKTEIIISEIYNGYGNKLIKGNPHETDNLHKCESDVKSMQ